MLAVTTNAKEKLRKILLKERTTGNDIALLRIACSSLDPVKLNLVLDTESEGDYVIMDNKGDKLLVIGSDVIPLVIGMILDFKETGKGQELTITRSS
jgi:Fe-S cluster assembly iron-binding protein IscA